MAIPIRYVLIVVFVLVSTVRLSESEGSSACPPIQTALFAIFKFNDLPTLGALASLRSSANSSYVPTSVPDFSPHATLHAPGRANATFVILARNSDLDGVIQSVRSVEDRFNHKYRYPYVFLNEEPFDDQFVRYAPSRINGECTILSFYP